MYRWREINPEKWEASQRKHLRKNAEKIRHDMRVRWLKRGYGLTVAQYNEILREQNGVCALCGEFKLRKGTEFLFVDHNHTTGKVRGLLCYLCNSSIGHFKDDPEKMRTAAEYLETRGV